MKIAMLDQVHLSDCADLYVSVFNSAPWHDAWTREQAARRLEETLTTPGALGLLAFREGRLVGFLLGYRETWFTGTHYYLKEMCVTTEVQRTGIGGGLIKALADRLRQEKVERIYLLTARDGPAAAFYTKHGFYKSPKMGLYAARIIPPDA
jgi:aminoglycoside 6'-N-acetyltransferase I